MDTEKKNNNNTVHHRNYVLSQQMILYICLISGQFNVHNSSGTVAVCMLMSHLPTK